MPTEASPASRRSVLLIIADDWSPAGCYGNPVIHTPHIDALAARGTAFDRAYCTTPSCAASRASLLTGLHSHTHGQYGHTHSIHHFSTLPGIRSVPAVLKDAGIRTGVFGKRHLAPDAAYPFDTVTPDAAGWSKRELAEHVGAFLRECTGAPFYAHVAPLYPHRVGAAFGCDRLREEFEDVTYDPRDVAVPAFLPDLPEVRQDLANYYQAVTRYDQCVGAVLEALERSGRADDTLVLVLTDHGMPFPGAKASPFDAGHHCPLIVTRPDQSRRGIRNDAVLNWLDLTPTIYDWLDVPQKLRPNIVGRSLLPILEEEHPAGWDETFLSHTFHEVTNYFPYRILRARQYKYIRCIAHQLPMPLPEHRSPTWHAVREHGLTQLGQRSIQRLLHHPPEGLYDTDADPLENHNLIDHPDLQDLAAEMRDKVLRFRVATRDPWLEVDLQAGFPGVSGSMHTIPA